MRVRVDDIQAQWWHSHTANTNDLRVDGTVTSADAGASLQEQKVPPLNREK